MARIGSILVCFLTITSFRTSHGFNGVDFELECPDECECHYLRINWITDCSESNITVVPYDELSLSLYVLDLNGNNITQLDPFPSGIKMRRLQIADNLLQSVEKESFAGLDYLIDVDLSGNNISRVDPEAFVGSPGLLNIELQQNPLTYYGNGSFLVSSTLQFLDISSCGLKNITEEFFDNITSLTTLDLSHNPLQAIHDRVFDDLTVLDTLKLNYCQLSYISDDAFANLTGLKHLELAGNQLSETEWSIVLSNVVRLEYLDLRNSSISTLSLGAFDSTIYLVTLILAENEMKDLDVGVTLGMPLQHLSSLDLSNCHIKEPLTEVAFVNATKLKTLYLSGNPLFASDLGLALDPLPKLEKLFLSNCGLRSLPQNFNEFTDLKELDISYNPLVDAFSQLHPLEKIEYLNMGYSNLSYIGPDTFSKMTSLKRLVLSGNDINALEAGLFGNLTQLTSLELNFCGLRRPFNANAFFKNLTYTDLREIKLAGNPLIISKTGPLLPKQLSEVTSLDLSNCNIVHLPEDAFTLTRNITQLNLAANKLNSQEESLRFLELLPELEVLDLGNNNLTTINPQTFNSNPNINSLRLVGNPFRCDCNIAEMWDWATMIKGDLDILVGSKTSVQDISVRGNKKKKSLLCHYDADQLRQLLNRNRTVEGRRQYIRPRELTIFNRTWAKYVRESGCKPAVKITRPVAAALLADRASPKPHGSFASLSNHAWVVAVLASVMIFTGSSIVWLAIRLLKRRTSEGFDVDTLKSR